MDEAMEAAAGAHFSGLRLDSLRLPIHSDPSSPSSARATAFHPGGEPDSTGNHLQPFHIGISGGMASLKTTVGDMISQKLHDHRVVLGNQHQRLPLLATHSDPSSPLSARAMAVHPSDDLDSPDNPHPPFLIGVSGGTASGKTTVCDMIIQQLHDHRVVLVSQDSFYRGLTAEESERVSEYNFDHPDAFDTEQLLECIGKLKCGHSVNVPIYDFKNHRRCKESFRKVNASDVIILEGILVFHDSRVRNMMDMKIFVDTDADIRLVRRISRDIVERGRDVNSVLEQYVKFVKPAFDDFVLPSKKYADVIIPRGGDNHVAIDLIVQHIRTKLGQHDLCKIYHNVFVIHSTFQIRGMHTLIRDRNITTPDFVFYSDRLIRLVVEHGLGHLPFTEKQVVTPTGSVYTGVDFCKKLCGISIIRSGESMENALRACCKGIKIGKILIHRDGDNGKQLIYEKLPNDISERHVLLLDPVLATGQFDDYHRLDCTKTDS